MISAFHSLSEGPGFESSPRHLAYVEMGGYLVSSGAWVGKAAKYNSDYITLWCDDRSRKI